MSQASAVTYRLSEVLRMDEHVRSHSDFVVDGEPVVNIKAGEYAWGFKKKTKSDSNSSKAKAILRNETPVLKGIDIELQKEDLLVVVGKIGSGKSSLLYSIMDETLKKAGSHKVNGTIAYVEQNPFIFQGTICDNICFGL